MIFLEHTISANPLINTNKNTRISRTIPTYLLIGHVRSDDTNICVRNRGENLKVYRLEN